MYFTHPQFKNFPIKLFVKRVSEAELKKKLAKIFPDFRIVFADSGRSAFQVAIEELGLENSTMLVPAYICDIFEPIFKHYNIKPVFLDIKPQTFRADLSNIESEITPDTKSILICHTYGLPAEMEKILEIAKKHNLKIIEDCAHIFPLTISGDCAFFSFAKLFPAINGGMLISKNPFKIKLLNYKFGLNNTVKFLRLFPILARFSELFRKDAQGIQGENSRKNPRKASKWSLGAFDQYLDNFEEQIGKRKELTEYFHKKLQEIGFQSSGITYISALVAKNTNRDELFYKLRKKNIFCSRIWHKPIFNPPTGGLPNTSEVAGRVINFPLQNWFDKKDIDKIIAGILSVLN